MPKDRPKARRKKTTPSAPASSPTLPTLSPRVTWLALAVIAAIWIVIRVRLLSIPLERDEGEYAYAGQLILAGVPPYTLIYNMKFPGIYYAYALVMGLFGQTVIGIHVGLLLVNIGALVMLFLIARRLFDPVVGLVAAAAYGFLTVNQSILGTQAHATHFVILPALAGILLALRAVETRKISTPFWSGCLIGVAVTMKQQGVFFAAFVFLFLLLSYWRDAKDPAGRPGQQSRAVTARLLAFAGGAALPLLLIGAVLYASGVFGKFWYWAVRYAAAYVSEVPLQAGLLNGYRNTVTMIASSWPVWIFAPCGLLLVWLDRQSRGRAWWVTGFLIAGFLTVCPGFYFRPHYYVTWMPAIALLIGVGIGASRTRLLERGQPSLALLPVGLFALALLVTLFVPLQPPAPAHRAFLFDAPVASASQMMYGENPWPEARRVADYVRLHSTPDETVAVLGSEPEIYFFAGRKSATGFIYTYPLMEPQAFASDMQKDMIREIEASKPKFVVFVNVWMSWLSTQRSDMSIFKWAFQKYLPDHYLPVGYIPPRRTGEADIWGQDAEQHPMHGLGDGAIYVFERTTPVAGKTF